MAKTNLKYLYYFLKYESFNEVLSFSAINFIRFAFEVKLN